MSLARFWKIVLARSGLMGWVVPPPRLPRRLIAEGSLPPGFDEEDYAA
jgi:hypothetical protein